MGFFSSIKGAISGIASGISNAVGRICSGIAGALGGTALGNSVQTFISKIGVVIPGLDVISAIYMIADIVGRISEALGVKERGRDEPEELAMKAEKDEMKPDDFDSTESYVKHLQQEIELTKKERERLENMSPEERAAYRATGTYLYTKCCNEKLGFDTAGLKNPELVGLTVEVLADLSKIQHILSPSEFVTCNKYLQANDMGMKEFSDYLHNRSTDLSTDEKVQFALVDAIKELSPDISDDAINQKLYEMNIEG